MRVILQTKDGGFVAEVTDFGIKVMIGNGAPPDVLLWGTRFFAYAPAELNLEGVVYTEVYVCAVLEVEADE